MLRLLFLLLFVGGCVTESGELAPISNTVIEEVPVITSVTATSGTFTTGQNLTFIAQFSEAVFVDGTPTLNFRTEGGTYAANYISGSGSRNLVFSFTVGAGMSDTNGVYITSPLALNAGAIYSAIDGENAELRLPGTQTAALISTGGGGGTTPRITGFSPAPVSDQLSGFYERGMEFYVDVNFDQAVAVTGTPNFTILIGANGGTTSQFAMRYDTAISSTSLRFSGIVDATHLDSDGIQLDTASLEIVMDPSNIIRSASGVTIDPSYTDPGVFANLKLDGSLGPALDAIPLSSPNATIVYKDGDPLTFTINFDRPVRVENGVPHMDISIGGVTRTANWVSDGGSFQLTQQFEYIVGDGGNFDVDLDGVEVTGIGYTGARFVDEEGAVVLEIQDSDIANATGAKVASSEVLHWYDLSENLTVTDTTSSNLLSFNDIMGIKNGILSSAAIPYSTGYMDFRSGDYVRLPSVPQNAYVLLVYSTGATNGPGPLLYNYFSGQNLLVAPGGGSRDLSATEACNNASCSYIDSSGIWQAGSGVLANVNTTAFNKQVVVFKLNRASALDLQIANASSFWFFEMLLIDGSATQANVKNVANQLVLKQGASY